MKTHCDKCGKHVSEVGLLMNHRRGPGYRIEKLCRGCINEEKKNLTINQAFTRRFQKGGCS